MSFAHILLHCSTQADQTELVRGQVDDLFPALGFTSSHFHSYRNGLLYFVVASGGLLHQYQLIIVTSMISFTMTTNHIEVLSHKFTFLSAVVGPTFILCHVEITRQISCKAKVKDFIKPDYLSRCQDVINMSYIFSGLACLKQY